MSRINNEIKNINNAIFSALKESAANEVSMWEKQSLKETGEWDDNDDEKEHIENNNLAEASVTKFQTLTVDKDGNEMLLKDTSYNHACSWLEKELAKTGSKVVDTETKGNKTIIKADNKTKFEYDEEKGTLKRLEESAANEVSMWEKQSLKETGEWDDNDDEMALWLEDLRDQAQELANQINGEVKTVKGFDKYQGPFAVVHSPKHGDIMVWYDQEDDTGRSFNAKVAHVGWITGGINNLANLLNQDTIPENEVLSEGSMEIELGKEADEWLEDQNRRLYRRLKKKYGPEKADKILDKILYGESDSSEDKSSLKEERVNMVVHKGDVFENQNGIKCTIVDVDNEHTIEGEPQVMFRFTSNDSNTQGETTKTVPMKNVVHMLNQNGYKKVY